MPPEVEEVNDQPAAATVEGADSQQQNSQDSPAGAAGQDAAATESAPKSALEAVKALYATPTETAAEGKAAPAQAAEAAAQGEADPEEQKRVAAGDGKKDWIPREQWNALPGSVKERIGRLTRERNADRDAYSAYRKANDEKVQTFDQLQTYLGANQISRDDFSYAMELIRLVRNDPRKAFEYIQPVLKDLQAHVGEVLPDDLQAAVDDGRVTPDYARQLAAERKERVRLEGVNQHQTRADQERQAAQRAETHRQSMVRTVAAWEKSWKENDPDYPQKQELVWNKMQADIATAQLSGRALTEKDILEIANKAKSAVEARLKGMLPRAQAKSGLVNGGASASTAKEPTSALEAARRALEQTHAQAA